MNSNNILTFKHGCFSGDLIYAMAGIKRICEENNQKAIIYQWLNQESRLYEGAEHPYGGKMMNQYAFDMMKPLIEAQPYVQEFREWRGEKVHIDLDEMRQVKNHMPYGNIVMWPGMVFAQMQAKYWEPWLQTPLHFPIPNPFSNRIIINRTSRYHAPWIDYFFMKEYQDKIIFVGMEAEYERFKHDWGLEIQYGKVYNFLDLAHCIASCKLFIGNQSMCYAIAEALKVPRLLEVCDFAPNVVPAGPGSNYFRAPGPFKYLVEQLMK